MSINLSVFGYPGWEADNEGNVYKNGKLIPGKVYQGYNRSHTSFPLIKRATLVCTAWHGPKPFDEAEVRHLNDIHDDDIREIRRLRAIGFTAAELAKMYDAHIQWIYAVVSRRKRSEVV